MPIYQVVCDTCGRCEEAFSRVDSRRSIKSTCCKASTTIDPAVTVHCTNTVFTGTKGVGIQRRWPKRSIGKARKLIGGDLANCIRDDGREVFRDAQEARKYAQRYRDVQRKSREKRGEDPDYLPTDEN